MFCKSQERSNNIMKSYNLKFGFTLAEVLITIGIIGVVAAITIPGLITNIQHRDYSAKLKKFYSTMKQAIISAEDDFGDVASWDKSLDNKEFVQKYLGPYIKFSFKSSNEIAYFADGSTLLIAGRGNCLDILYDVTGEGKPNKEAYDRFRFLLCPDTATLWGDKDGGFYTYKTRSAVKLNSRQNYLSLCKQNAIYCSALLEYDNWNFNKDYPYYK